MVDAPASTPGTPSRESILDALNTPIEPVRIGPGYKVGMACVAVAMVILPLVYLGLIGSLAYGLYHHATANLDLLEKVRGRAALLVYVGPLVVGAILIVFMIKPLFAPRAKGEDPHPVDPSAEPFLFAFVARVARLVGAPAPREIHLDTEVNASASFRRGLVSMLGSDLTLTIGLPLVAGLPLRALTGVLAHEFGHFAQGGGMRMTYIIRTVNAWFARVVYERDAWDESLTSSATGSNEGAILLVLNVARFLVWLTRKVLWVLMMAGHGISCYMLRQMEYDADRHAARVAGPEAFELTGNTLGLLVVSRRGALADLAQAMDEGRLGDDLMALTLANIEQVPPEVRAQIRESDSARTELFDTHPSHRDRIESVRKENTPGVFTIDAPASVLFADFGRTCREVTAGWYRQVLGERAVGMTTVPSVEIVRRQQESVEDAKCAFRYFQRRLGNDRVVTVPAVTVTATDRDSLASRLVEVRERLVGLLPATEEALERQDEAHALHDQACAASLLLRSGYRLKPEQFHLSRATDDDARTVRAEATRKIEEHGRPLAQFEECAGTRLAIAIAALDVPSVAEAIEQAGSLRGEARRVVPVLEALRLAAPSIVGIRGECSAIDNLMQNLQDGSPDQETVTALGASTKEIRDRLGALAAQLEAVPYPLDHARGAVSLAEHVVGRIPPESELLATYECGKNAVESWSNLRLRLLGRLAHLAERVEAALGLEPLPVPDEPAAQPEPAAGETDEA